VSEQRPAATQVSRYVSFTFLTFLVPKLRRFQDFDHTFPLLPTGRSSQTPLS